MTKVLCLIDTLSLGGGAERQMAGLAGLLHEKGINVTLATYHKHKSDDAIYQRYGIKSKLIVSGSRFYQKLFAVKSYLKQEGFDVVIAYKDGPTMIACLCKLMGCNYKLIVSERNTTQNLSKKERLKFWLYRFADVVVPNSHAQGEFIKKNYYDLKSKVNVITNFVDINLFKAKVNYSYSMPIKILIVGRINPQKNLVRMIHVASCLKRDKIPVSIDWYGGVHVNADQYANEVKSLCSKANISDYLSFKEETPNIADVYRHYHVFCLPSLFEGFPNVICEAMSSGLPIICSKVCDNPNIVLEGVNGFMFDPLNEGDIYDIIKKVSSLDTDVLTSMGEKSRELAVLNFSEEAFVNKYIALL